MTTVITANRAGVTTFGTSSAREVVMTRVVEARRRHVFEAWTNPEHLPHWLLGPDGWTMPVCEIDLRPGGAWRCVWRDRAGAGMEMHGVYREITPPGRVVYTESPVDDSREALSTLVLSEQDGKTSIMCTMLFPSKEARDAALRTGMQEGVSASFDRLSAYLRTKA